MGWKGEARLLLHAVQLMTRLPIAASEPPAADALARSAKYFPVAGLVVGSLSATILLLSTPLVIGSLPALLAIGAGILITGALHEDGLADTADGLGGGSTPARRLEIMKDSRTGAYGVIALVLVLAIKAAALSAIVPPLAAAIALVAAHAGARAAPVIVMACLRYAGDPEAAKLRPAGAGVTRTELTIAVLLASPPLLLMPAAHALTALAIGSLAATWPALAARKLIGGYTGDILGTVEQAFEAGFLVGAAIFWTVA